MKRKRNEKHDTVPEIYMNGADETAFPAEIRPGYGWNSFPVIPGEPVTDVDKPSGNIGNARPEYRL